MLRSLLVKRSLILMLVIALCGGGVVLADGEEQIVDHSLKVNFTDVERGNWAQKHVSKLALLGVTDGYTDGTYRPNNNVTQQEVIKMALSLMGFEEEDDQMEATHPSHIINFINGQVDSWARPWVSLAFTHGVLDYSFESGNHGSVRWGEKQATRDWIAKIIIQAIGEDDLAADLSNNNSIFVDHDDIFGWALGYVNAAVELGIVTGDTQGRFNPLKEVTRAELAAFLSRGENFMENRSERVLVGTLLDATPSHVTILDERGESVRYVLHAEQQFYTLADNYAVALSAMKPYTKVALIIHNDTAYYVEVIDDEQQLVHVEGIVVSKSLDSTVQSMTVQVRGVQQTYRLANNVEIINKAGSGVSINDIVEHSTVSLKFDVLLGNLLDEQSEVIEITLLSVPVNKKASGTVADIDLDAETIVLQEQGNGERESYTLEDVVITSGNRTLNAADLETGDEINYTVSNNVLTAIDVTNPVNPYLETVQGTITSYVWSSNVVTIRNADGRVSTWDVARNPIITLEGLSSPTLQELENGDMVRLQINSLEEIIRIEVLNRKIERMTQVELFTYDPVTSGIAVRISQELKTFNINDQTVIIHNDVTYSIKDFDMTTHFTEGRKLDLTFTNDKLMTIRISNHYDGIVRQVNTVARTVTITSDGADVTFTIPLNTPIVRYSGSSVALNDLVIGETIRISFDNNQTNINLIQVKQPVLMRVVSTQQATRAITAKDQAGKEVRITLHSSIPLRHYALASPSFTDIKVDDLMIAQYIGMTAESIDIAEPAIGKISSIGTQRITVTDYDGQHREWQWSQLLPQVYDGATGKALSNSSLKIGDRVQIVADKSGQLFVTVLDARKVQFWRYDSSKNLIYYRNETAGFTLADNVFITENGVEVPVTHFVGKGYPEMIYYMLNGIVYEIEKK